MARKESNVGHQLKGHDTFSVLVESAEGEIWQESKAQQQAAEDTKDVGDVIDPRQEEEHHDKQLQKGPPQLLQYLPSLEQLNKQASQEPILGASRTSLQEEKTRESFGFSTKLQKSLTILLHKPAHTMQTHEHKTCKRHVCSKAT